jgi:hypothetical protein
MLQNPTGMKKGTLWAKYTSIYRQVSPASLPDVFAGYYRRALVDESGLIRTQIGNRNR